MSGEARILSREEIEALVEAGEITPIDQIRERPRNKLISNEAQYERKYYKYPRTDGKHWD